MQSPPIVSDRAELYDKARAPYPESLFDDVMAITGVTSGAVVLEIGCGTGQATVPLARRGLDITAVELGRSLAAVARQNLSSFPNISVVETNFESWQLPERPYDLVLSATAFHWVAQDIRVPKVASALRPGGWFGLIDTVHIAESSESFFVDVQQCYERWDIDNQPGDKPPSVSDVPPNWEELTSLHALDL